MQERKEVCIEMKSPGLWAGLANYTLPVLPVSQLAQANRIAQVGAVDDISQPWSILRSLKVLGILIMIIFNPAVRILTVACLQSPLLPTWSPSHLLADHRGCFHRHLHLGLEGQAACMDAGSRTFLATSLVAQELSSMALIARGKSMGYC